MAFELYNPRRGTHAKDAAFVQIYANGIINFSPALAKQFKFTEKMAMCVYYDKQDGRLAFDVVKHEMPASLRLWYKRKGQSKLHVTCKGVFEFFKLTEVERGEYSILKGRKPTEFQIELRKVKRQNPTARRTPPSRVKTESRVTVIKDAEKKRKAQKPKGVQEVIRILQQRNQLLKNSNTQACLSEMFKDKKHYEVVSGMGFTTRTPVQEL